MRIHPALAVALIPVAAAAQTDEWLRDDMSDDSLSLLRTSNLTTETPNPGLLPGAVGGASQWVMSRGDGPAYVVYFIPGRIHEVEVDTHRLAGASGDFTLAVSTDGKLYQPINAGSVLLDSSFGWDYRLMSSDQIPPDATHLLVRFPDGSSAHRLSEVWIKFQWDDALASRFLPPPVLSIPANNGFNGQSDAELETLFKQLDAPVVQEPASIRANIPDYSETSTQSVVSGLEAHEPPPPIVQISTTTPLAGQMPGSAEKQVDTDVERTVPLRADEPVAPLLGTESTNKADTQVDPTALPEPPLQQPEPPNNPSGEKRGPPDVAQIEIHLDQASDKSPTVSGDKEEPVAEPAFEHDGKPDQEVVWVLPTFTSPIVTGAKESDSALQVSPTPKVHPDDPKQAEEAGQVHPAPEEPATDSDQAGLPISKLALDRIPDGKEMAAEPAAAEFPAPEMSGDPATIKLAEPASNAPPAPEPAANNSVSIAETVPLPAIAAGETSNQLQVAATPDAGSRGMKHASTFARRGPRSKSHTSYH